MKAYMNGNLIQTLALGGGGDDMHTYSTTEQAVGEWIDGRTVYERVFTGQFTSGETTLTITFPNIEFPIDIYGAVLQSDVLAVPFTPIPSSSAFITVDSVTGYGIYDSNGITITRQSSSAYGDTPSAFVILRYVKSA